MKIRKLLVTASLLTTLPWTVSAQIGPVLQVNTYTPGDQLLPAVAADGAGNFVAVWRDVVTGEVRGQRYDSAGSALGGEFVSTTDSTYGPVVAADGAGCFVVVWRGGADIVAQRYDSTGAALGGAFQVNTYTSSVQDDPAVALDGAGNVIVVWDSFFQDGDSVGIFGQRYDSTGAALGGDFQVNTYTTAAQSLAAVAADGAGNVVVVWNSLFQDSSLWGIFGQRYDSTGAVVGGEFQVSTYTTNSQFGPQVAADGAGNFVVAWASIGQDGEDYGIFGQRFDSGGNAVGAEFQVNTYTTGIQGHLALAVDGPGNFVVVWHSEGQDGDDYGIFGQRYDSTGSPTGAEFPVNGYALGRQFRPSVAAIGAGSFVTLWESEDEDGDGFGIFGQRWDAASRQGVFGRSARLLSAASGGRTVEVRGKEVWSNSVVLGDPITYGATVRVIAHGDSDQDQTFSLPPGASAPGIPGWKVAGTGWTYTDTSGVNGPVRRANLRQLSRRTLFVQALIKGTASSPPPGVALVPPGNGTDAGLIFTTLGPSGGTYCVHLGGPSGGTVRRNSATRFVVRAATTEAGCPSP